MKSVLIRGVPLRMQQDGWWLNPPRAPSHGRGKMAAGAPWRLGLLAALIALGDVLMWDTVPGLSLAVFAAMCMAAALCLWPRRVCRRQMSMAVLGTALSVLPLVELVQPLSVLIAMAGLPLTLALVAGRRPRGAVRFWWAGPWFTLQDAARIPIRTRPGAVQRALHGWALPLATGLLFALLLVLANPVFDLALSRLVQVQPDVPHPGRFIFWTLLALLLWPILHLARFAPLLAPDPSPPRYGPTRLGVLVNPATVTRSLVLFNAMFAAQNVTDVAVLIGGAGLPDGLSYAEYAHRGAYPLIVLALLSGGFALLARPFTSAAPALRALLLIWVAQTVWLTCSSILRLDLYVDAYGLTRLRLAAAIWMGLVLAGLLMILYQIARVRPNAWLLRRVGLLGAAVLYACGFASFDAAIARYNLTNDVKPDWFYLCTYLGEAAVPVLLAADPQGCAYQYEEGRPRVSEPRDWREWGFRNARVRHKVAAIRADEAVP